MTNDDLIAIGKELAQATRVFVAKALGDIGDRLKTVEARIESVKDGQDGAPGPKGDQGDTGPQGEQGLPGTDGDIGLIGPQGEEGPHGVKGDTGPQGEAGPPGPSGEKGEPGSLGLPGEKGIEGPEGKPGRDGRDGVQGLTGGPGDRGERGESGERGIEGKAGQDGINLDFWTCEITKIFDPATRLMTERYVQGDRSREITWTLTEALLYRGVFSGERAYEPGDTVTWGGSLWICKAPTSAKPGENIESARAWTLAVKRGADGKQGPAKALPATYPRWDLK